jgi:hypothetical protein
VLLHEVVRSSRTGSIMRTMFNPVVESVAAF